MLRVAVPNKGSLAEPTTALLEAAGYRVRSHSKELAVIDEANQVQLFYLRPRDIATYVGSRQLDIGITGRDLLIDSGAPASEVLALGFAGAVHRYATSPGTAEVLNDLNGKTIATSYPNMVAKHLTGQGVIPRSILQLEGAVEVSLRLGLADAIADVVVTGEGLARLGLTVLGEPIMVSEGIAIRPDTVREPDADATRFLRRLSGVLVARDYVMIDYHVEQANLDAASQITPGLESPTVAPLNRSGWVAVRAMVAADEAPQVMDRLEEVGATGILSMRIESCRIASSRL